MNKYLLILIIFFSTIILSGCSVIESPEQKQKNLELIQRAKNSKFILVDVHHNGCEPCKFIKPIFENLEIKYDANPNIAFLTYDLSNPFKANNSLKIAKELGLEKIYKAQRYTGIVLIIDTASRGVIDTLIAEDNEKKYIEVIEARLAEYNK